MDISEQLDISRTDLEMFAAALAVRQISRLIANGGSDFSRPDLESALHPQVVEAFLVRAVAWAQQMHRFEQAWLRLRRTFPSMKSAWEQGQRLFLQHLAEASGNQESMEYLSQVDFAADCHAFVTARNAFPTSQARQKWLISGYMVAWRDHFLQDEEDTGG